MLVKNLVKSMLILSLLVTSSFAFSQQQKMTPEQRAQRQLSWMQQNLSLTGDQSQKVSTILTSYAQQAENARSAGGTDMRSTMQQINQNREADIKAVLTADQYQKLSQHMQEMRQQHGGGQGGGMQQGGQ